MSLTAMKGGAVALPATTPRTDARETPMQAPNDAQEAILAKAREMDAHRKIRAIFRLPEWRLSDKDNGATIIHRTDIDPLTSEAKTYSDTSRLRNGFDCNCADAGQWVRPMRAKVAALLCGTPVSCQHVHIRTLLRGGVVMVFCPRTSEHLATAQMGPDGVHARLRVEQGMDEQWKALVAVAVKDWGAAGRILCGKGVA